MIPVRAVLGLGRIPHDRTSAAAWLNRHGARLHTQRCNGGHHSVFHLSDLPEPERRAFLERQIEAAGLPMGEYDDGAHDRFLSAPLGMREAAERRADIARFMTARREALKWRELVDAVHAQFGDEGTSEPSLRRILNDVAGIAPLTSRPRFWLATRAAPQRPK